MAISNPKFSFPDRKEIREYLENKLRCDLIGPGWIKGTQNIDLNEELDLGDRGNPQSYYLLGYIGARCKDEEDNLPPSPQISYPSLEKNDLEIDHKLVESVKSEKKDFAPRSIGLSISPENLLDKIDVKFDWGEYRIKEKDKKKFWIRKPKKYKVSINLKKLKDLKIIEIKTDEFLGIRFQFKITMRRNLDIITVRVVNDRSYEKKDWKSRGEFAIHQMKINIKGKFQDIRLSNSSKLDPMDLLYHYSTVLSYGHNIGVGWSNDGTEVWSDYMPRYEVPLMKQRDELQDLIPRFENLTNPDKIRDSVKSIELFIVRYEEWINEQVNDFENQKSLNKLRREFENNLSNARKNIIRMRGGIETLLINPDALEAFRLANMSIWKSQTSSSLSAEHKIDNFQWRPFQFAFQLINIEGIIDKNHESREIVDLAWFPTGGGKTEAYLGLIALLSFYRRLKPETAIVEQEYSCIHTIMRYTLRLLTADQASRLVRAIGAMNNIADSNQIGQKNGFIPFRLGMWIGKDSSPNVFFRDSRYPTISAKDIIDNAISQNPIGDVPISIFKKCPWCGGNDIGDQKNYSIQERAWSNGRPTLHVSCENSECPFNDELPFTCIDEDIYLNPPTILLSTADKFIQIAYNKAANSIKFNNQYDLIDGSKYTIRRMLGFEKSENGPPPPELIIQDELHLLTGPLGTIAGLFETALDFAWLETCDQHRLKYIAATATIRGADRDVGLMYGRNLNIFPPPILKASDNFFAEEVPVNEISGRLHLAIQTPFGKALTSTEQPAASILQCIGSLRSNGIKDNLLDPYWTLVMYYNSLRELGGGQSSLSQNIPRWMENFSKDNIKRELRKNIELTSRRSSSELSQHRSDLSNKLGAQPGTVDVLSTSNMFQVGIDISRLGTMMIIGQPRSNSEYIQSSGRVGRGSNNPGLVLSVLRSTFPRDQSHYELFRSFHQEFYRHVDRTSITPFSQRALDRAFETTLMMFLRMSFKKLSKNEDAQNIARMRGLRSDAILSFDKLVKVIEKRMIDFEADDMDIRIIRDSVSTMSRQFKQFQNHAKRHTQNQRELNWLIWNERGRKPNQVSFFASPFRPKNILGQEDHANSISSMRDISEEIRMFEQASTDFEIHSSLPESHLFGHASPGSIWEQGGFPIMTGGISKWALDTKENVNGALLEKLRDNESLLVDEPILGEIFGEQEFLVLPRHSSNDTNIKNYASTKLPAVEYSTFPTNYWVCSDSVEAHIRHNTIWNKTKKQRFCSKEGCDKKTSPGRFISLCDRGHIEGFDYHRWAHMGSKNKCRYEESDLVIRFGSEASFTLRDWNIVCLTCNSHNDMSGVPWVDKEDPAGFDCKGRRPWLHKFGDADQNCDQKLVHREVGNSSITFNETSSIMLIPPYVTWNLGDKREFIDLLDQVSSENLRKKWTQIHNDPLSIRKQERINELLKNHGWEGKEKEFLEKLDEYRQIKDGSPLALETLKIRERRGFILEDTDLSGLDPERFQCRSITEDNVRLPQEWALDNWPISNISRVDRLTELKTINGIKRVNPSSEYDSQDLDFPNARAGTNKQHGIAMYNYGEGVYIDIKSVWLQEKGQSRLDNFSSKERSNMTFSLKKIHDMSRRQNPALNLDNDPLAHSSFTVLHTLSHMVIREFSLLSGFSLGSVRERLYLDFNNDERKIKSCGILIYTSGSSSDGTLGGLIQQASSIERINNIFKNSLMNLDNCSNDPVCIEHNPRLEEPNGAACHSCVLLPEPSCEFQNYMLDRNWGI